MKIILSQYAGFCDGVKRAYLMAEKIAKNPKIKKPIYILGSLVHNEDVAKRIESLGIKKIHVNSRIFKFLDSMKKEIGTLVITAHGMGPKMYEYARKNKIDLVDATCPKVIKVQRLAKLFSDKKYQVVIVGEKDHKEIKGIFEWANRRAIFIESVKDYPKIKLNAKRKIAVISQTTQDQEFLNRTAKYIKKKYPQAEIIDTICLTTRDRQNELKKMAKKNDAVVIIGSPTSANSTRLWQIAKRINARAYFIERSSQVKKSWFQDCQSVGVSTGASTPMWVINEVVEKLRKYV